MIVTYSFARSQDSRCNPLLESLIEVAKKLRVLGIIYYIGEDENNYKIFTNLDNK